MNRLKLCLLAVLLLSAAACKKDSKKKPGFRIAATEDPVNTTYYYDEAGRCRYYLRHDPFAEEVTEIVYYGREAVMTTQKNKKIISKTVYYINETTLQADSLVNYGIDYTGALVPLYITIATKNTDGTVASEVEYSYEKRLVHRRYEYTWDHGDMIHAYRDFFSMQVVENHSYDESRLNTIEINLPWMHRNRHLVSRTEDTTFVKYGPYHQVIDYHYTFDDYGRVKQGLGKTYIYEDERYND